MNLNRRNFLKAVGLAAAVPSLNVTPVVEPMMFKGVEMHYEPDMGKDGLPGIDLTTPVKWTMYTATYHSSHGRSKRKLLSKLRQAKRDTIFIKPKGV